MNEDRMNEDQLRRVHLTLADALRRDRDRPFDSPVTVAEIYQDLVPYRNVRTTLGFDMNADYEHTLLRLLAGEGHLARLEPPEAREELRAELESPNPNVGLFRKFAACDVWVSAPPPGSEAVPVVTETAAREAVDDGRAEIAIEPVAWEDADSAGGPPWDLADDGVELILDDEVEEDLPPVDTDPEPVVEFIPEPTQERDVSTSMHTSERESAPRSGTDRDGCAFCDSSLPTGRTVRFCPFCGADQSKHPCPSCGETLEADWAYCIACGAHAPSAVQV
jgi:hypothetical protein